MWPSSPIFDISFVSGAVTGVYRGAPAVVGGISDPGDDGFDLSVSSAAPKNDPFFVCFDTVGNDEAQAGPSRGAEACA